GGVVDVEEACAVFPPAVYQRAHCRLRSASPPPPVEEPGHHGRRRQNAGRRPERCARRDLQGPPHLPLLSAGPVLLRSLPRRSEPSELLLHVLLSVRKPTVRRFAMFVIPTAGRWHYRG